MLFLLKWIGGKIVFNKIKAKLAKKAKNSVKSTTMGVATLIIAGGGWIIAHPEIVAAVSPKWAGVIVAAAGLLVAIARTRSL